MPGPSVISRGNIDLEMVLSVNIAAGTVATNTCTIVTVAVPGLIVGDFCQVSPQQYLWAAAQPAINLTPDSAWCAAANVLTVAFSGLTGAVATQTTPVAYLLNVARSQNYWANNPPSYPTAIV
jgi:hypothetical protein